MLHRLCTSKIELEKNLNQKNFLKKNKKLKKKNYYKKGILKLRLEM